MYRHVIIMFLIVADYFQARSPLEYNTANRQPVQKKPSTATHVVHSFSKHNHTYMYLEFYSNHEKLSAMKLVQFMIKKKFIDWFWLGWTRKYLVLSQGRSCTRSTSYMYMTINHQNEHYTYGEVEICYKASISPKHCYKYLSKYSVAWRRLWVLQKEKKPTSI